MLINPFTVIAQIINFTILVVLLKRFLYDPVIQAMEKRSQWLKRQLEALAIEEKNIKAQKELCWQKQLELEAQQQKLEWEKAQLIQTAILRDNSVTSTWYEDGDREHDKLSNCLGDRLSPQMSFKAQKASIDSAKANLEEQIIETFIDRLYNLNLLQTEIIYTTPIPYPRHIIIVCSSFAIAEAKRQRLTAVIREQISAKAEVQFETKENLPCGIELRDRGYKISWNLDRYLTELDTATAKAVAENSQSIVSI